MQLKAIELRQFRNIKSEILQFHSGLNILRGQNGQGKTNLVEAIHLLTHGKSFRTLDLMSMVHIGDFQNFLIRGRIEKENLNHTIEIAVQNQRKQILQNQKRASGPFLKSNFPSVLFSPESLMIIKESAQKRRDLIDDLCAGIFPQFTKLSIDCRKLLKQKNTLLKQVRDEQIHQEQGRNLLKNITQLLFEKSSLLIELRLQAIRDIRSLLLEEFLKIMDDHYGDISVDYLISGVSAVEFTKDQIVNAMYKRWKELSPREVLLGQCLVGPHKHEISFNFNGHDARFFCSQGQQRAIILAFKMAHIRLHYAVHKRYPILLLDDVLSELDREKQERFLGYLMETCSQIFLTTTDASPLPEATSSAVFTVSEGRFIESTKVNMGGLGV